MQQKILIIEDDTILASMYQTLLVNHGYVVYVAHDGEEGMRLAFSMKPDLMLLDIDLPKIGGLEVMKRVRADSWGKGVKICILTNLDVDDQRLAVVVTHRPVYYLIKSNNSPEEVSIKIREVLEDESIT